jgi:hypothetical protein
MFIQVNAGQREKGQPALAENSLCTAFVTQAYQDLQSQREKFIKLAGVTRKCSDNFLPEKFAERDNANMPVECLDKIMEGNIKALGQLAECLEEMKASSLFPVSKVKLYTRIVEEEETRLEKAGVFWASWKLARGLSSQPEHNAV